MFRAEIKTKLANIFGLPKVTFDAPSEAKEQEGVFVTIENAESRVTYGRAIAKVTGSISIFAVQDKLPFGFLNKKINSANVTDTANFFFYNIDQNEKYFGNLVERKAAFVYFYNAQYDPDAGVMDEVNLTFIED